MIHYEYPLSERIRTLLRLEDLFDRFDAYATGQSAVSHHAALLTLFEITEVSARADLKSDLLQELDRQKAVLAALRGNDHVDQDRLEDVLDVIDATHKAIHHMPGKVGQHLRDDEWLMAIKQRSVIPGGLCEFDQPGYHHWLHRPVEERSRHLLRWLGPFAPIRDAIRIVMRLLRESAQSEGQQAPEGVYKKMLEGRNPQLIRVSLRSEEPCVPEISANKYVLNIRFVYAGPGQMRACTDQTVDFELGFCAL